MYEAAFKQASRDDLIVGMNEHVVCLFVCLFVGLFVVLL